MKRSGTTSQVLFKGVSRPFFLGLFLTAMVYAKSLPSFAQTPSDPSLLLSTPGIRLTNPPIDTLVTPILLPDLIISSLKVTKLEADSIRYAGTLQNIGLGSANLDGPTTANSDNVSIQAFVSSDKVFGNSDDKPAGGTVLGIGPLGLLKQGEERSFSFGASIAVNVQTHPYLLVKADWGEVVAETNERNNVANARIPHPNLPDLIVSFLEVTTYTEDSIQYSGTIQNIGPGPANLDGPTTANSDNVSIQAFVSRDEIFGNSDDKPAGGTILGISPLGFLHEGEQRSFSFGASITASRETHPYLLLSVDWGNVLREEREDNNTASTRIVRRGLPDLVVGTLVVTDLNEESIRYKGTIENIGRGPANLDGPTGSDADNVSVQAFLSSDRIFGNEDDRAAGGTILGASPLGELKVGELRPFTFGASVDTDPKTHPYLLVRVDWGEVVKEEDEENNVGIAPLPIRDIFPEPEDEPDDLPQNARVVSPGSEQLLNFRKPTDQDWITFLAAPDQFYQMRTHQLADKGDTVLDVFYQSPNRKFLIPLITGLNEQGVGKNLGESVLVKIPIPSFIFVRIRSLDPNGGEADTEYFFSTSLRSSGNIFPVFVVDYIKLSESPPGSIVSANNTHDLPVPVGDISVTFLNLSNGVHELKVTVPPGYQPRHNPCCTSGVTDPHDIDYGNPRLVNVPEDAGVSFAFVPSVQVEGSIREASNPSQGIEGAYLTFHTELEPFKDETYSNHPNSADNTNSWVTSATGAFPTNIILPGVDWDIMVSKSGYVTKVVSGTLTNLNPNGVNVVDIVLDKAEPHRIAPKPTLFFADPLKRNGIELEWEGLQAGTYRIETIDHLLSGAWNEAFVISTNGLEKSTWQDLNATNKPFQFYRLEFLQNP